MVTWLLLAATISASAANFRRRVVYTHEELEFSAREVRRYVRLATGHHADEMSLRTDCNELDASSPSFNDSIILTMGACAKEHLSTPLSPSQHKIITNNNHIVIIGAAAQDVLFGAYTLAEQLGIHFSLHGDILPDPNLPLALAKYAHQPLSGHVKAKLLSPQFDYRGLQVSKICIQTNLCDICTISKLYHASGPLCMLTSHYASQPFHDFGSGPDWWSGSMYKHVVANLAKMKMNFLGLHTYPYKTSLGTGSNEPTVWVGLPEVVPSLQHSVATL